MKRQAFTFFLVFVFLSASTWAKRPKPTVEQNVSKFIDVINRKSETKDCQFSKEGLRVAVLGFHRKQKGVGRQLKSDIQSSIEQIMQSKSSFNLAPSSDLGDILELARSSGHHFQNRKIRKLIRDATGTDLVIVFKNISGNVSRNMEYLKFRMIGITKNTKCKIISRYIYFPIEHQQNFSDLNSVMEDAAFEAMSSSKLQSKKVNILPFYSEKRKFNGCSKELQTRLYFVIDRENKGGSSAITENHKLDDIRVLDSYYDIDKNARSSILAGKVGQNKRGTWISIDLLVIDMKDGHEKKRKRYPILSRRYVPGMKYICDPKPKSFIQYFSENAKIDKHKLIVKSEKKKFKIKRDPLVFYVTAKFDTTLYCWYIGSDKTAYILSPNRENLEKFRIRAEQTLHFPRDFGFPEQYGDKPSKDLFGCFAPTEELPDEVRALWMEKWGTGGAGKDGALTEEEINDVLGIMRKIGNVEAYTPVRIVK